MKIIALSVCLLSTLVDPSYAGSRQNFRRAQDDAAQITEDWKESEVSKLDSAYDDDTAGLPGQACQHNDVGKPACTHGFGCDYSSGAVGTCVAECGDYGQPCCYSPPGGEGIGYECGCKRGLVYDLGEKQCLPDNVSHTLFMYIFTLNIFSHVMCF